MTKYIPVHDIVHALSFKQSRVLLSVYCLSGCDACGAFYGRITGFNVIMECASYLRALSHLATVPALSADDVKRYCTHCVGLLYGSPLGGFLDKFGQEKSLSKRHIKPKKATPNQFYVANA